MKLSDLLKAIQPVQTTGETGIEITGVNIDSRLIGPGHLFIAVRGTQTDGHAYIPSAIAKGAVAVLCEEMPQESATDVTYVVVKDSEEAVGKVATTFYGDPLYLLQGPAWPGPRISVYEQDRCGWYLAG